MRQGRQLHSSGIAIVFSLILGWDVTARAQVFSGTGANSCNGATVILVSVGPIGSPVTTTIMGDNSAATGPDCTPSGGVHAGPVWWEAFRITERATVTIDLCGTIPVLEPSYDLIYKSCVPSTLPCVYPNRSDISGRGAPFCSDENLWSTHNNLVPGTYRIPILSDPGVLVNGLGPYVIHIHASACPGSCCHTNEMTCEDCVELANCANQGDFFRADRTCAQVSCNAPAGPDLVVGAIRQCKHLGRVGDVGSGTVAASCMTTACNKGNMRGNWIALPDTDHPVIGVNFYRMESVAAVNRFQQIGQSWLKHGFGSANDDECGFGCVPGAAFEEIGVGCSDTYSGYQFESCNLGPRSMINPYTGVMPGGPSLGPDPQCWEYPSDGQGYASNDHRDHIHTPISHKAQVQEIDLDPNIHPGARYFGEGFYIAPHEYSEGNGNQNNNVSHVELSVSGPDIDGVYAYSEIGFTASESPAIDAWTGATQSVIEPVPLADGRAFLAWEVTDLGGGTWHYEYAIYNMNLDRSVGSLSIPLSAEVVISDAGFYAPPHHAPELHSDNYSGDPWDVSIDQSAIDWSTESFAENPFANAVRFGTLYNFWFNANLPPIPRNAIVGLFKSQNSISVATLGPGRDPPAPLGEGPNAKARFISFSFPAPSHSVAGNAETALRVTLVSLHHVNPPYTGGPSVPFTSFEGQTRWVGPPVQNVESTAGGAAFYASHLQCTPHYQDWSTVGLLHVTGSAIVPSSTYEIENVAASCKGVEANCTAVSAPLAVATARWADVETPYNPPSATLQPDLADVSALVNKFRNAPGAPIKARALLVGGDTFGEIDIATEFSFIHISACVDAFRGRPYPHMIAECP